LPVPADWSLAEVELVVADYFAMLADEPVRRPYNKTERRERLKGVLNNRSDGSIEFKRANISAVLINFHSPYIAGYKPRFNYQPLLEQVVLQQLEADPTLWRAAAASPVLEPAAPPATDFAELDALVEEPPEPVESKVPAAEPRARRVDFVARDAMNRRLGAMGEEWAVEFERRRLHDREQRPDLAKRVEWVSQTRGDGLGYDISSFHRDASPRPDERAERVSRRSGAGHSGPRERRCRGARRGEAPRLWESSFRSA
jgi:hypothetical protein